MFKKIGIPVLLAAFCCAQGAAQAPRPVRLAVTSTRCLGADNDVRLQRNVVRTPDGGILLKMLYVLGTTGNINLSCVPPPSGGLYYSENLFIKLDSNGTKQWDRCYANRDSSVDYLYPQPGGGELQVGTATLPGAVSKNFIRKTRPNGAVAWTKYFSVSEILDLAPAADGGYFLTGSANATGGDISSHYGSPAWDDIWLLKLDSTGTKQWLKVIGGSIDESPSRVLPLPDGGALLVGTTNSNDYDCTGGHNPNAGTGDVYVCRIDPSGAIRWHRSYGGTGGDVAKDALGDEAGGAWIAANAASKDGDVTGQVGTQSAWLLHIDSAGTVLWNRCFNGAATDYTAASTLCRDGRNALWVGGYCGTAKGGDVDTVFGKGDGWVLRLDSSGTLTGSRVMGTSHADMVTTLAALAGQRMLVGGWFSGLDANPTMPQAYYNGTAGTPNVFLNQVGDEPEGIDKAAPEPTGRLLAYPNPPREQLHIRLEGGAPHGQLRIFDAAGRSVYGPASLRRTADVSTANWTAGTYQIVYAAKNGAQLTERVVIP